MTSTTYKTLFTVVLASIMICTAAPAMAKVTAKEAAKLKTVLNPMGGEIAGNKEGTIPEWTGGLAQIPEGIDYVAESGLPHPDPYPDDKILFTITAQNVDQYKDKLSPGMRRLFEMYPDTWKMHVYPTRRSAAFSKEHYEGTYDNALTAEVVDDYGSIINYYKGYPFPIPKSGAEAILNFIHIPHCKKNMKVYQGGSVILANGQWSAKYSIVSYFYKIEGASREEFDPTDYVYGKFIEVNLPGRVGELYLMMDPANYSRTESAAWSYIPGMRRVRRNPNMWYDGLDSSLGGIGTMDDAYMFSGKLDRFDWTLTKEKKEMFVPYNTYKMDLPPDYDVLMTPHHPDPEYMRWELHRVWENVATLKEGARHIYGKRVFYQDEDTWLICVKDQYDTRGNLWRTSFADTKQYYDFPESRQTQYFLFDFQVDFYVGANYFNGYPPDNYDDIPDKFFTVQNLRKMGRR